MVFRPLLGVVLGSTMSIAWAQQAPASAVVTIRSHAVLSAKASECFSLACQCCPGVNLLLSGATGIGGGFQRRKK